MHDALTCPQCGGGRWILTLDCPIVLVAARTLDGKIVLVDDGVAVTPRYRLTPVCQRCHLPMAKTYREAFWAAWGADPPTADEFPQPWEFDD